MASISTSDDVGPDSYSQRSQLNQQWWKLLEEEGICFYIYFLNKISPEN